MTDPRIISIVSIIFAIMGSYSLYVGSRRIRDARLAGHQLRWYRQIGFLAGIEYILLTFVFLLTLANREGQASPGERNITVPLYFLLLICAAIVAGMVIRRGILDMQAARARRFQATQTAQPSASTAESAVEVQRTKEDLDRQARRQRERRKNAAAARRRHAGKA